MSSSLHFPQTNRILLAHVKQNGIIPSTKEVRVMSACTVLISGNATYGVLPYAMIPGMGRTKFTTFGAHDVITNTSPWKNDHCTEDRATR